MQTTSMEAEEGEREIQTASMEAEEGEGERERERQRASTVERAHGLYREGKHEEALRLYSQALALQRAHEEEHQKKHHQKEKHKKIVMALHSNRAACLLKMRRFREAAAECTAVLELEPDHAGALMLRAQTLVTLRDYQAALFDVARLLRLDPQSPLYQDLHARLRTQLALPPIPEEPDEEQEEEDEPEQPNLPKQQNEKQKEKQTQKEAWEAIPKPKGHSGLDYSRWDQLRLHEEDDAADSNSDSEDDDAAARPQYRFRVRTVSMRHVK